MLTIYNQIVLVFWAIGLLLSIRDRRARSWVLTGAGVYILSVLYWRTGSPAPEVVAGILDFMVIVALWRLAVHKWELIVMITFMLCLLLNLIHALGASPVYEHTVALEILNILTALFIGGVAELRRDGGYADAWIFSPWRTVLGRVRSVHRNV